MMVTVKGLPSATPATIEQVNQGAHFPEADLILSLYAHQKASPATADGAYADAWDMPLATVTASGLLHSLRNNRRWIAQPAYSSTAIEANVASTDSKERYAVCESDRSTSGSTSSPLVIDFDTRRRRYHVRAEEAKPIGYARSEDIPRTGQEEQRIER